MENAPLTSCSVRLTVTVIGPPVIPVKSRTVSAAISPQRSPTPNASAAANRCRGERQQRSATAATDVNHTFADHRGDFLDEPGGYRLEQVNADTVVGVGDAIEERGHPLTFIHDVTFPQFGPPICSGMA